MTANALAAPMTEQEQRIAMAEACGWKPKTQEGLSPGYALTFWTGPDGRDYGIHPLIPDYPRDHNATHSAKLAILTTPELQDSYACHLGAITGGKCIDYGANRVDVTTKILFATAAQETEAILRTIGKWKE